MEFTIIEPDRTQPEKTMVHKTYPGPVEAEHFGKHYCPCCHGYGPGEGVGLCSYCGDRLCGEEYVRYLAGGGRGVTAKAEGK